MKRRNWTEQECATVIRAYFEMLNLEQRGVKYSKADFARRYVPQLNNRTKGSYEMKLMNVSAALVSLNLPTINGYKPYGNAQKLLKDLIKNEMKRAA